MTHVTLAMLGLDPNVVVGLVVLASVWSVVWKGLALWRAAQLGQKGWFIVLLVLNTLGVLEIIYLFLVSRRGAESASTGVLDSPSRQE